MKATRTEDWTVLSMMEWATDYFAERGIPDARHSIEWLLAEVLEVKRLDLYLKFDRPLSRTELEELRPMVKRRASHEPLQYITGYTDFMNARITVGPEVLIPRIETEQLVEIILEYEEADSLRALDLGTGSGCISIALKQERPGWELHAVELSPEALKTARRNAEANGTDVHFLHGDMTAWRELPLEGPFDLIVSNPPYVRPGEKDGLQKQVADHEPAEALYCEDLKAMYGSIRDAAAELLADDGRLYLEIHENNPGEILDLFDRSGWQARMVKDYEKKPRFVLASRT
ncbi:MAG: peptide chain release factor N(5)-glutamine methyltransferase [Balneolaceae bacterium]|nr:peptide chain release factor N(5)-glutamine methyltransferase [Balneolaceae bacterium]